MQHREYVDAIRAEGGFRFSVSAAVYDGNGYVVGLDFAPDHGDWTYSFAPTLFRPVIADSMGPTRAVAVTGASIRLRETPRRSNGYV